MMISWHQVFTNPELIHVIYDNGVEFDVLKTDFNRDFDIMLNTSAKDARRDFEVKYEVVFEYYEIQNKVSRRNSEVTARWATLEQAKEDMRNHEDIYKHKGTGRIYCVIFKKRADGAIMIDRSLVAEYN